MSCIDVVTLVPPFVVPLRSACETPVRSGNRTNAVDISTRLSPEEHLRLRRGFDAVPRRDGTSIADDDQWLGNQHVCLQWTKGKRTRFRGERWLPHRLLYWLVYPEASPAMQGKMLQPTCGTVGCVQPAHQSVARYAPPPNQAGRKRKGKAATELGADDDAATEELRQKQRRMELVRQEFFKLQETLARIDAAVAALPPELHGTDAQLDAEQAALRDPNDATNDESMMVVPSDLVWMPEGLAEAEYLRQLEQDPFGTMMRTQLGRQ